MSINGFNDNDFIPASMINPHYSNSFNNYSYSNNEKKDNSALLGLLLAGAVTVGAVVIASRVPGLRGKIFEYAGIAKSGLNKNKTISEGYSLVRNDGVALAKKYEEDQLQNFAGDATSKLLGNY
jgi:hypothetical protein